jgi:hypothetical protein
MQFLDGLADKIGAEIQAVLEAVAAAPPPSFSGGGKWEAMHEGMAGFYEVRVQGGGANHRLFCLLNRDAENLGGSSIICIDGLSKPVRSAASPRDYRRSGSTPRSSASAGLCTVGRSADRDVHRHGAGQGNHRRQRRISGAGAQDSADDLGAHAGLAGQFSLR